MQDNENNENKEEEEPTTSEADKVAVHSSDRKVLMGDPNRPLGEGTTLPNSYDKMAIRQSPLEGFGVFATDKIPAGTILEETPVVVWPLCVKLSEQFYELMKTEGMVAEKELNNDKVRTMFGLKHPTKYYFKWFPPNTPREGPDVNQFQCLPLGYGPVYNSANGLNNAIWEVREKTFVFTAIKDINEDEEIQTFYGYMVSEDGTTFEIEQVLGMGLELVPVEVNGQQVLGVFLRAIRFSGEADKNTKVKSEGYNKLANAIMASGALVKFNKINVLEDDGKEVHPFDFPLSFPLKFTFMKLKEFKETRFKKIQIHYSYQDIKTEKEVKETVIIDNPNV